MYTELGVSRYTGGGGDVGTIGSNSNAISAKLDVADGKGNDAQTTDEGRVLGAV